MGDGKEVRRIYVAGVYDWIAPLLAVTKIAEIRHLARGLHDGCGDRHTLLLRLSATCAVGYLQVTYAGTVTIYPTTE
jgi:hypothetical protein